jgi:hypothetical protein
MTELEVGDIVKVEQMFGGCAYVLLLKQDSIKYGWRGLCLCPADEQYLSSENWMFAPANQQLWERVA